MKKISNNKKHRFLIQVSSMWSTALLAGLAGVLFVITALVPITNTTPFPRSKNFEISLAPLPVFQSQPAPYIFAQAAIIYDPVSAVVLFEKNADTKLSPVSTTKIVTATLALTKLPSDQVVEVPDIKVEPQIMKLVPGERITVRDLLYGVLVWSANDAAEVIARAFPGGRDAFLTEMNTLARSSGMYITNFVNPSGLPEPNHYSTARDLARFASIAMENSEFAQMVQTKDITVTSVDGLIEHRLVNLNELLVTTPGVLGVKTGWSEETGGALITYVKREEKPLIIVVFGSQDRFADSRALIEWAYGNYKWK